MKSSQVQPPATTSALGKAFDSIFSPEITMLLSSLLHDGKTETLSALNPGICCYLCIDCPGMKCELPGHWFESFDGDL